LPWAEQGHPFGVKKAGRLPSVAFVSNFLAEVIFYRRADAAPLANK
jgi:hypothetical protein